MRTIRILCLTGIAALVFAQPRQPDVAAQREAMKKLEFLVGKWEGDAKITPGPGEPLSVRQGEEVRMKLDGLVMVVEGTGRDPQSGKVVFNAMAMISYDDASGAYKFRSYNEGRYLDTELKVQEKGFEWGLDAGPAKIRYVMKLGEKGEWGETGEITFGASPARRMLEMTLRRVK